MKTIKPQTVSSGDNWSGLDIPPAALKETLSANPASKILLYRSWFQNSILHRVTWKGREYSTR
ncbi:hypothetical protein ACFPT7_13300 [Acidicapsa dinghuensis]|uniref:Uncharacterized protein n=1 Tax=Acidicapsa dinghuensis TaxID=2218256 RepID=A0ABW1EJ28_9BACT|nr:hypothetical protein [Acidicapsa dinghuensis]